MTMPTNDAQDSMTWQSFFCRTAADLTKALNKFTKVAGVYFYRIPQAEGCILNVAIPNPDVIQLKAKPRVRENMTILTEMEVGKLKTKVEYVRTEQWEIVENFVTWLYENGFRILNEKEAAT